MDIQITQEDVCTVIGLNGRLDATQAGELQAVIQKALGGASPNLLLDCANLSYVASMGLRCFLMANKSAQTAGGRVVFTGVNENVRSIFSMTSFDKFTTLLDSVAEALSLFRAESRQ
jgi:anti-anti-sigma factor